MKLLHAIAGLIIALLLGAGALYLLSELLRSDASWVAFLERLGGLKWEAVFACVVVLFILAIYGLSAIPTSERVQYLAYEMEGGGLVSVSLRAIQDFVARIADEFSEVVSLQATVKAVNGSVDVQLDVKVKAGARIPELCRMMQDRARECIRQNVGISDVKEVRVRVQEIVGQPASETLSLDSKSV